MRKLTPTEQKYYDALCECCEEYEFSVNGAHIQGFVQYTEFPSKRSRDYLNALVKAKWVTKGTFLCRYYNEGIKQLCMGNLLHWKPIDFSPVEIAKMRMVTGK